MGAGASTPGTSHQDGSADAHHLEPSDYYERASNSLALVLKEQTKNNTC